MSAARRGKRDRTSLRSNHFGRVLYPAMLRRIRRAWIAAYVSLAETILPSDGYFRAKIAHTDSPPADLCSPKRFPESSFNDCVIAVET
jgi:hypothetical protein